MITVTEEYVYYHSCLGKIIKQWKHAGIPLILRKIKVHSQNLYGDVTWSVDVLNKIERRKKKHNLLGWDRGKKIDMLRIVITHWDRKCCPWHGPINTPSCVHFQSLGLLIEIDIPSCIFLKKALLKQTLQTYTVYTMKVHRSQQCCQCMQTNENF